MSCNTQPDPKASSDSHDIVLGNIAIIGAGLGGAALALCLSSRCPNSRITIYESRAALTQESTSDPPSSKITAGQISSGVILTPNSLSILDTLGVFDLIRDKCYISTYRCFKDRNDVTVKKTPTALEERYGYANHRLWRKILLDTMIDLLSTRSNVKILYSHRLSKIHPSESPSSGVEFSLSTPSGIQTNTVDMLFGCDGLHSAVRSYMYPTIEPEYTGTSALLTHIPRSSVSWPTTSYERNATIQDIPAAIFFLPEDPQGETIMVGRHLSASCLPHDKITTRSALADLQNDKSALKELFTDRFSEFGSTSQSILSAVAQREDNIFLWPYMRIPRLESWWSHNGRVVLLGDAAHAVPASSGQGAGMVIEDSWMLALLLAGEGDGRPPSSIAPQDLKARLRFWQMSRQQRIEDIVEWVDCVQNVVRLGREERAATARSREAGDTEGSGNVASGIARQSKNYDDMTWLYSPNIESMVKAWFAAAGE